MPPIEQRILGHAVAAGVVRAGSPLTSLAAEGVAWTALKCASALAAGVAPHRDVAELGESLRQAGASNAEIVYVQFAAAEIFSIAQRLALQDEEVDLEKEIQCRFRWTDSPHSDGGPRFFAELMRADDLSGSEREQSISIYLTAMLMAFGNQVVAFRAWACGPKRRNRSLHLSGARGTLEQLSWHLQDWTHKMLTCWSDLKCRDHRMPQSYTMQCRLNPSLVLT